MPKYNRTPDIVTEIARLSKRQRHLERVNQMPLSSVTRTDGTVVSVPELAQGVAEASTVYRGPTAPWPAGDTSHTADDGDLWWQETTITDDQGNTSTTTRPYLWDATDQTWADASDPQLNLINATATALDTLQTQIENSAETATSARNLASTADGRVSMSDYDPTSEDVTYYSRDRDDQLVKGVAWTIVQAKMATAVVTLTVVDAALPLAVGAPITVEGLGAPYDGERIVASSGVTSVGVTQASVTGNVAMLRITVSSPWVIGRQVVVAGVGSPWDGLVTLTDYGTDGTGPYLKYALTAPDTGATVIDPGVGGVSVSEVTFRLAGYADVPLFDVASGKGYNAIVLARNEGSVWFTRTRPRRNLVSNPSFETDTTGWMQAGNATLARTAAATVISGSYAGQVTNGTGIVNRVGISAGFAVTPGQKYAATVFALLQSGSGVGAYAYVWYESTPGTSVGQDYGVAVDLSTTDWRELQIAVTVPADAQTMYIRWYNPNANDVWLIDGALVEQAAYTGRYFDGRSYDARWAGTVDASVSIMNGGKVVSVFELYDSGWTRLDFTDTVLANLSASDITQGTLSPTLTASHSITQDKLMTNLVIASENLTQGDIVNLWSNNGLFNVRKADAANGYLAHGFVMETVTTGAAVYVYTDGYNPYCTSLTPGTQYLSTIAGKTSGTPPLQTGRLVQKLGVASDSTTLHFQAGTSIKLT